MKKVINSATSRGGLPRAELDYAELFSKLGFLRYGDAYFALSADGQDVLMYDDIGGTCYIFVGGALNDRGRSLVQASYNMKDFGQFLSNNGIEDIQASLVEMVDRMEY